MLSSSGVKQPNFIAQLSETRLLSSLYLREETFLIVGLLAVDLLGEAVAW
jgi:hypothetical protein